MKLAAFALVVLCTVPTCGGRYAQADGTSVAQTRILPPIPKSAPTALGPIPLKRVKNLMCDTIPALGCFHRQTWVIEIRDSLPLPLAWVVVEHELFHADMQIAGIEFDEARFEDAAADAAANGRVLRMRAGWPR